MAVGRLHDQVVSFISYYTPNTGQTEFFSKMLRILDAQGAGTGDHGGRQQHPAR